MLWWWFLGFSTVTVLSINCCVLLGKSSDDSYNLKNYIASGYYKNLPPWDLEAIHDYFHVYLMYFRGKHLIGSLFVFLWFCCSESCSLFALSLFFFTSCHLSSLLIHTQTNKQTNKQRFLLPPGLLPAVLMSTGKGQNQPSNKGTRQEAMLCSLGSSSSLFSECQQRCPLQAEVSILEILEEFSHLVNFLLLGIK